jgi:hypothetical protein
VKCLRKKKIFFKTFFKEKKGGSMYSKEWIRGMSYGEGERDGFRFRVSDCEVSEDGLTAAYVLTGEKKYIVPQEGSGMKWRDSVFVLRWDPDTKKEYKKCIRSGEGESYNRSLYGHYGSHYRFILKNVVRGVLTYFHKYYSEEFGGDLMESEGTFDINTLAK